MDNSSSYLSIQNIRCSYDDQPVIHDLSLEIQKGELVCLLGHSGCGKTTILRAIAGFEPISQGSISLKNKILSTNSTMVPPEKRNFGMVFQDYALFPHLSVADNICFSRRSDSNKERQSCADQLLKVVGLEGKGKRFPHELSGGQQQRVALARALAQNPEVILMDEPFCNLDVSLRERLALEVREILISRGITGIMVTHDQHEAFAIADKIAVMHDGMIQQWDNAYNLYHSPANRFVANFIGQGSLLKGSIKDESLLDTELGQLHGENGKSLKNGCPVEMLIRPDDLVLNKYGKHQATVVRSRFQGADSLCTLRLPTGTEILGLFPSHQNNSIGGQVTFDLEMDHLIVFESNKDTSENMGTPHQH